MTEPTNADRAEWAMHAIETFIAQTGTDQEDALCDLLADLMHYADAHSQDFDLELERARRHYEEEINEGVER